MAPHSPGCMGCGPDSCDDLFGFVLYVVRTPGVTKSLQVDYRSPVPLGEPHRIRARLVERDGRKLHMSADGTAPSPARTSRRSAASTTTRA